MYRHLYEAGNCIIGECTPGPRTIAVDGERYFVHFPYTVFLSTERFVGGNTLYVFGSKEPLRTIDDKVFRLPLPNTYDDGRMCMGGDEIAPMLHGDLRRFHAWAVSVFFQSRFSSAEMRSEYWKTPYAAFWREAQDYREVSAWGSEEIPLSFRFNKNRTLFGGAGLSLPSVDFYRDKIERHAYFKWMDAGCPPGQEEYFWHLAEQEIVYGRK